MEPYASTTLGKIRWWIQRDLPDAVQRELDRILADPDAALQSPSSVARTRVGRKRFYRLAPLCVSPEAAMGKPRDRERGQPDHAPASGAQRFEALGLFVKVFRPPRGAGGWLRSYGPSRALREARIANAILARGISAAAPIAVGEERRMGSCRRSFSIVCELSARDLRTCLLDPAPGPATRRGWLEEFGRLNARLHRLGVDQDDTSPNNFLVAGTGEFTLIDFERCKVGAPLDDERRWHLLAKLERHDLGVGRTDRLRFLRAYLEEFDAASPSRERVRMASGAIAERLLAVRRNDARRAAAGAFQEGRHVERVRDEWRVRGRAQLPTRQLECGPAEARRLWILAHQLERLHLPALRPVRIGGGSVFLVEPHRLEQELAPAAGAITGNSCDAESRDMKSRRGEPGHADAPPGATSVEPHRTDTGARDLAIARARREFERFGSFRSAPHFGVASGTAWLENLTSFELSFSCPKPSDHGRY